ncbi:MAG TPA: TlpA family protein disulfide reductase [Candidatus Pseudomonas excrementavium]|uniref:TlpA disulfide reductase family protein n=1 Tax=Halopseudomonas bauzanensis TaxID=653930 RepID=UPI001C3B9FC8|nr:TlpA disulfide reductase family protein [Halopseudomonas bauzanensis]HIZ50315.1 TlpA family protein disulfide reductase [Candidatus Pseudomonas excrementavium]
MMSIGPFPVKVVGVFAAILLAWLVTRAVAKRMADVSPKLAGAVLFDAVFWGVIAARLGYIAQWWEDYFATPVSMLAIGDGGYSWWIGVPAALAFAWWRTRTMRVRRPVLAGIATGVAAWFTTGLVVGLLHHSPPLPELHLNTLEEQPISLLSYQGRPTVVNLWATWCPPCRREMPVFEQAQAEFPGVDIVMVNQGESAQQAQAFLESQGLTLSDVLLDPFSRTMHAVGARALPTTLFFDAEGQLVDSHMGELTMASFKSNMSRHFAQSAQLATDEE